MFLIWCMWAVHLCHFPQETVQKLLSTCHREHKIAVSHQPVHLCAWMNETWCILWWSSCFLRLCQAKLCTSCTFISCIDLLTKVNKHVLATISLSFYLFRGNWISLPSRLSSSSLTEREGSFFSFVSLYTCTITLSHLGASHFWTTATKLPAVRDTAQGQFWQ